MERLLIIPVGMLNIILLIVPLIILLGEMGIIKVVNAQKQPVKLSPRTWQVLVLSVLFLQMFLCAGYMFILGLVRWEGTALLRSEFLGCLPLIILVLAISIPLSTGLFLVMKKESKRPFWHTPQMRLFAIVVNIISFILTTYLLLFKK